MLRHAPFAPPGADSRNPRREPFLLRTICPRRQLDERMQRDLSSLAPSHLLPPAQVLRKSKVSTYSHPRTIALILLHKVRIDAPNNRLMAHNQNILAPLQLHDDRLQPDHHIPIALPAPIAIVILVVVAVLKVLRVRLLDLGVRHAVADAGVELVERLPLQLGVGGREETRRRDGAA
jgi:hypothetical protein